MRCPDHGQLAGFTAGAASEDEAARIDAHLTSCADCRDRVRAAETSDALLGSVRRALDAMIPPVEGGEIAPAPGRFRILRRLGEGGMGVVYEAEQQSPKRSVALKLLRPGFASAAALRRFEHEAEALGRLRHPGIAQIHEAGSFERGGARQPYVAMELVRGLALSRHLAQAQPDLVARLRLFVAICDAVHHAHQKGVIHRDLKPGNILVTAAGRPVVVDFGVARIADAAVGQTLHTEVGHVVGTLPYMSPEQVRGDASAIDIRSDVYALGAILYEMLCGALPLEIAGRPLPEAARIIEEREPMPLGARDRRLRGDLETIAAAALAKNRERRYASAWELARDVERVLAHEPIGARAPSAVYQLRKFCRRHRTLVAAAALLVLVLTAGIVTTWTQMRRAQDAERAAVEQQREVEAEALSARAAIDFLGEVLIQGAPGQTTNRDSATTRQTLEYAAKQVDEHLAAHPVVQGKVHHVLGDAFLDLGDAGEAQRHLEQALSIYESLYGERHRKIAYVCSSLARASVVQARFERAQQLAERALSMRDTLPENLAVLVPLCLDHIANVRYHVGDLAGALDFARRAVEAHRQIDPRSLATAVALGNLATIVEARGDPAAAEELHREALAIKREELGAQHVSVAATLQGLAELRRRSDPAEAEELQREALAIWITAYGEHHEAVGRARRTLGAVLWDNGARAEGEHECRRALEILREALHPQHPQVVQTLNALARMSLGLGHAGTAEDLLEESVEIAARTLPKDHVLALRARTDLGALRVQAGRPAEATAHLEHVLAHAPADARWATTSIRTARRALVAAYQKLDRFADSEALLLGEWRALAADGGAAAPGGKDVARRLAVLYEAWGKQDEADAYRRHAQ